MRNIRTASLARACCTGLVALLVSGPWPGNTAQAADNTSAAGDSGLEEVVVSARKKDETALSVPVSITTFSAASIEKLNINSFTDYATKVPNLSFSYGSANWGFVDSHTVAIRGIQGFGTTGVYIDDTPVPDSLDPRVVDIQRIEVLKGPQGTLFGQGSLGGTLRLITVQPSPTTDDIHYTAKVGDTDGAGSPDYAFDFAGSHPIIGDTLLARVVGFYDHQGGFLHRDSVDPNTGDTLYDKGNYGANRSFGGSVAFRWIASDRLDIGLRVMAQETDWDGWQAPYAPLPAFDIQSFTMDRTNDVQEMARDRFYLPALTVAYKGDKFTVNESLSYFDRRSTQIEDGSEGTRDALIADWGAFYPSSPGVAGIQDLDTDNQAFPWTEVVSYRRTVSETRVSFDKTSFGLSGVVGLYMSRSFSDTQLYGGNIPLIQQLGLNTDAAVGYSYCGNGTQTCQSYGSGLSWFSYQPSYHQDRALFGEVYQDFANFELTLGGRLYHQTQHGQELEAGALNFAYLNVPTPETRQNGFDPKVALKYNFDPTAMVYVSYSKGFRAGGAGVPLPGATAATPPSTAAFLQTFFNAIHYNNIGQPTTYNSDTVENYEVGGKIQWLDGKLALSGALFQMNWDNIQQTIIAPVSYITLIVNAGNARVRGGEMELEARPVQFVALHAGLGFQDAVISKEALYWQPEGSRVYQVPKVTASASARFTAPVTGKVNSFLAIDGSYVGSSVSGTAGCQLNTATTQFFPCPTAGPNTLAGYPIERGGYQVLNASIGLEWGQSELSLYANNLTNARPNLGDFNPESYAKHSTDPAQFDANYGEGYIVPRVATLRPLALGLQFRQRF